MRLLPSIGLLLSVASLALRTITNLTTAHAVPRWQTLDNDANPKVQILAQSLPDRFAAQIAESANRQPAPCEPITMVASELPNTFTGTKADDNRL